MNDPMIQRELDLARTRVDARGRVAEVDRLLRERHAAEPKATDALLDTVASALIGAGERLKARRLHLAHEQKHAHAPCACPEPNYP